LKIILLQDHLRSGGAARAASRWERLLTEFGHTVVQVAGDEKSAPGILLTGKPPRGWGRVLEIVVGRGPRKKMVNRAWMEFLEREKPDLVWAHNIAGGEKWGWSVEMLCLARETCPVLWTLHDMWGLADRSESYWDKETAVEGGRGQGAEQSGSKVKQCEGEKVGSRGKSRVGRICGEGGKYPVTLTAPSRWLAELTDHVTGQSCRHLPNPIDLQAFSPGDRAEARRSLGLPPTGLLVLAGADSLHDPRKGMDLLAEAWREIHLPGAQLVLFGRGKPEISGSICLGSLESDRALANAYRAADLYVHPARMENAPCTIQESQACGTPVLAFAVGGIPEMVEKGRTGFLCQPVSAATLGQGLKEALSNPARLAGMSEACRQASHDSGLREKFETLWKEIRRIT